MDCHYLLLGQTFLKRCKKHLCFPPCAVCSHDESLNQKAALSLQYKSGRKAGLFLFRVRYMQESQQYEKIMMPGKKLQGKKICVERGGSKEMNWQGSSVLVWGFF